MSKSDLLDSSFPEHEGDDPSLSDLLEWSRNHPSQRPENWIQPGLKIGNRYQPIRLLGRGGMGEVYVAWDPELHRFVALKVVSDGRIDLRETQRLSEEAQHSASLNHRNVVTVYDFGKDPAKGPFLVMQLVGESTFQYEVHSKVRDYRRSAELIAELASGLAAIHHSGRLHLDIKFDNILIDPEGHPVLIDFGIATYLNDAPQASGSGTPGWWSPEQRQRGNPLSERSDLYSLGQVLYKRLTNRRHAVDGPNQLIPWEAEERQRIPAALRWICEKCLAWQPEERFASARDLEANLRAFSELRPLPDTDFSTGLRTRFGLWVRRSPVQFGLLFTGMMLIVAAGMWAVSSAKNAHIMTQNREMTEQMGELVRKSDEQETLGLREAFSLNESLLEKIKFAKLLGDEPSVQSYRRERDERISAFENRQPTQEPLFTVLLTIAKAQQANSVGDSTYAIERIDGPFIERARSQNFEKEARFSLGEALMLGRKWQSGLDEFSAILRDFPEHLPARWRKACCLFHLRRWTDAKSEFEIFLSESETTKLLNGSALRTHAHSICGECLRRMGKWDAAIEHFDHAFQGLSMYPPGLRFHLAQFELNLRHGRADCAKSLPDRRETAKSDLDFIVGNLNETDVATEANRGRELAEALRWRCFLQSDLQRAKSDLDAAESALEKAKVAPDSLDWADLWQARFVRFLNTDFVNLKEAVRSGEKAILLYTHLLEIQDTSVERWELLLRLAETRLGTSVVAVRSPSATATEIQRAIDQLNQAGKDLVAAYGAVNLPATEKPRHLIDELWLTKLERSYATMRLGEVTGDAQFFEESERKIGELLEVLNTKMATIPQAPSWRVLAHFYRSQARQKRGEMNRAIEDAKKVIELLSERPREQWDGSERKMEAVCQKRIVKQ